MLKETTSGGGETVNNYYPGGPCGGVPYGYVYGYGYPPCNNGGGWNLGNLLGGGTVNFGRGGFGTGLAGLITGAVALAAIGANGGLRNLLGGWGGAPYGANGCCDGGYVTHKELSLVQEINKERSEKAALVAQTYTDRTAAGINARITRVADDQALINCATSNDLGLLNRQAREVSRMTTRIIKPSSLATSQAVLTAFNNRLDALAEGRAAGPTPADEEPAAGE
jgi:hypothetical protein